VPTSLEQANQIKAYFAENYSELPIFVAGDFNEEPESEPIQDIMKSAFTDLYSLAQGPVAEREHPAFTTFKFHAQEGWVKRTVDYIFIAKNDYYKKNGCAVLEYLDPSDLERDGLLN